MLIANSKLPFDQQQNLRLAAQYQQGGRIAEAENMYRRILALHPQHAETLHYLGALLVQTGRPDVALPLLEQAKQAEPGNAAHWLLLTQCLLDLNRLKEAKKVISEAIRKGLRHPKADELLELARSGRAKSAERVIPLKQEAAALEQMLGAGRFGEVEVRAKMLAQRYPKSDRAWHILAMARMAQRQFQAALEPLQYAINLNYRMAELHFKLGHCYEQLRLLNEAVGPYSAALELKPGFPEAYDRLFLVLIELGRYEEALKASERILRLRPDYFPALNNMALSLHKCERVPEAVEVYRLALSLGNDFAELHSNYADALKDVGELNESLAEYRHALTLKPDPNKHFSQALLLLFCGEFEAGWEEYEYGLACGERQPRFQELSRWRGEPLSGKTLLVCAEQGLGDEIMFASILPEIIREAGHCVVECDPKLVPIYRRSFPTATVIRRIPLGENGSDEGSPLADIQVPVGSLALYRRNRLEDFPRQGYLKADPERVAYWKGRLDELGDGLKVGISWRGGILKTGGARRSIPLSAWLPILKKEGMHFISLQYTPCDEEIQALEQEHGIKVVHWQEAIGDYAETAALVCALDLVISVQTAIVHLSGALGKPVWTMLPISAEWRYLNEGGSMPWYPSVRLFRQRQRGEWQPVINDVAQELTSLSISLTK